MNVICPECKNDVNLSGYGNLEHNQIIECDSCGMTLMITDIQGNEVSVDIVDEGK